MGYSIADIHYFFEEGLKYIGIEERRTRVFQALMKSPFNPIPRMNPVYNGLPFSRLKIFNLSPSLSEMYAGHAFKGYSPYQSFSIIHDLDSMKYKRRLENNCNSLQDKQGFSEPEPNPAIVTKVLKDVINELMDNTANSGFIRDKIKTCKKFFN